MVAIPSVIDFSSLPRLSLPDVELAYIERGTGPLVLCLHGFPDNATSYLPLMELLAAQGYRVVAPFMRGYYPSSLAADGDYSVAALARDVLALIRALGERSARVIGHDWGGLAACCAANMAPDRISQLVVASAPHLHDIAVSPAQLLRSWHMALFRIPVLSERWVARRDFRFIDRLYQRWSPHWTASTWHLDSVKASLSAPGALSAALGYYRAKLAGSMAALRAVTTVPALVVIGEEDGSAGVELFTSSAQCYSDLYDLVIMPGVGHFPHIEEPQLFARRVQDFFAMLTPGAA